MSSGVAESSESIPKFTQLNNLAANSNGSKILFATDDFFAVAENLLLDADPKFDPSAYTDFGKLMDGWETRRKRIPGHDWCIIKLAAPCLIRGIVADTAHFTGNYVPRVSLQAAVLTDVDESKFPIRHSQLGEACSVEDWVQASKVGDGKWTEIVKITHLRPGYENTRFTFIPIDSQEVFTHIRLNIFPDGGIARLRVHGEIKVDFGKLSKKLIDLMSVLNGTICYGFSNAHFSHPGNLIKPLKSTSMADGWETARRLDRPPVLECDSQGFLKVTGSEYALFRLGTRGRVEKIVIDTSHFKGNFPDCVEIEGVEAAKTELISCWRTIVSKHKLAGHQEHVIEGKALLARGPFTHIKIIMMPDGGLSRIRIFGFPA